MRSISIHPKWILVARVGWVSITLFFLTTFILGLPYRYSELAVPCDAPVCPSLALSSADEAFIHTTTFSMQGYASFQLGFEVIFASLMLVMAALIFWKAFDNRMGIFTAYMLSYIGLVGFVNASAVFAAQYPSVEWLYDQFFVPMLALFIFIFPNGRFPNKWSLIPFVVMLAFWFYDAFLPGGWPRIPDDVGILLFLGTVAIGVWSQIYRYRNRSTPVEKQQTKWLLFGIVSVIASMAVWSLLVDIFPPSTPQQTLVANTIGMVIVYLLASVFPVTLMIAVTRYGLWGIDLIVRRTLQYTLLTALLALVYFGSVVILQSTFGSFAGEQSPVAIVISTLLIAALFTPLRRRVQRLIDRRFYRQKYDKQQVLAHFAITARDETDMNALAAELARVVQDTMQPETVSLWLRREHP